MIKSDDFGDVRPQFCFVRPRWCLSRTYVLSGEKNYLQPCCRVTSSIKFTNTHLYTVVVREAL